jgi:oligoribonuclease
MTFGILFTTYLFVLSLGGNGLFDDILASKTTKEEMERQLLELLKRHCPEKGCPLAGSSIHVDREVVRLRLPSIYEYLHYRIIDVSSFFGMAERWLSPERWIEKEKQLDKIMQEKYSTNDKEGGAHRAMYDVERSIEILKLFKPCLVTF